MECLAQKTISQNTFAKRAIIVFDIFAINISDSRDRHNSQKKKKGENWETVPGSPQIYTPITANVYVALEVLKSIWTCSNKQKKHKFSIEKMFVTVNWSGTPERLCYISSVTIGFLLQKDSQVDNRW